MLQTMESTVNSDARSFRELPQLGAIWLRNAGVLNTADELKRNVAGHTQMDAGLCPPLRELVRAQDFFLKMGVVALRSCR